MPRILIVDDDVFFRKVITKIFAGRWDKITTAASGEEALDILKTKTFDLMLLDVNMVPMNGLEVLERVHEAYPDMGVIMLTSYDEIEVAVESMKKGAFDFIAKPVRVDELFSTVQRSIKYYNIAPAHRPLEDKVSLQHSADADSPVSKH